MRRVTHWLSRHGLSRHRRLAFLALPLAAIAVAVVTFWLWFHSAPGRQFLKEKLEATLGESIEGRVEIGSLETRGLTEISLRDVRLFDPDGERVAQVAVLSAALELRSLFKKVVRLTSVEIEAPQFLLRHDEQGFNLLRAVAAKPSAAAKASSPAQPSRWRLEIESVAISRGGLRATLNGQAVAFEEVALRAAGSMRFDASELSARIEGSAQMTSPIRAPLSLEAKTSSSLGNLLVGLSVSLGDSHLRGSLQWPELVASVDDLALSPTVARAFFKDWPLRVDLLAQCSATPTQASVSAQAGNATLQLKTSHRLEPFTLEHLSLKAQHLDFLDLLGAPRHSTLDVNAEGSATDLRLQTLSGSLKLSATWADSRARQLARLTVRTNAVGGAIEVPEAFGQLPGVSVSLRGSLSQGVAAGEGRVDLKSLRELGAALNAYAGLGLPPLSGTGQLSFKVSGPLAHPALVARGRITSVSLGDVSAQSLALDAELADVTKPWEAQLHGEAGRLVLAGRALESVAIDVASRGRAIEVGLQTQGFDNLALWVRGKLDADARGMSLDEVRLSSLTATWALENPSRLMWSDGLVLEPLSLRDGQQRLVLELAVRGRSVEGKVEATRLNLAALPRLMVPESWGLEGELGLAATVEGAWPKPHLQGSVTLRRGALWGITDIEIDAQGRLKSRQLTLDTTATTSLGAMAAHIETSVPALVNRADEPIAATLSLRQFDLGRLGQLLGRALPAQGQLSFDGWAKGTGGALSLGASVDAPSLALSVGGHTSVAVENFRLTTSWPANEPLTASVAFSALGGTGQLALQTPLTLAALQKSEGWSRAVSEAPVKMEIALQGLNLSGLAPLEPGDELSYSGVVRVTGAVEGSVSRPRGSLVATLARFRLGPLSDLDASATLTATDETTRLTGRLEHQKAPMLALDAQLSSACERLIGLDALAQIPISFTATLFPTKLEQLWTPADDTGPPAQGTATASLAVSGTIASPHMHLTGSIDGLQLAKARVGSARWTVESSGTQQRLALALGGLGRDDLKVKGTVGLDVRPAAWVKGMQWKRAPVELALEARRLDLAFLSGLHPMVRALGGKLDLEGRISGTLGEPLAVGEAHWSEGRVGLSGFGDYRDVDIECRATNTEVEVKRLTLRAGAGSATMTGRANRLSGGVYALKADVETQRLPIINDDQLRATMTAQASLEGRASSSALQFNRVELDRVEVELPDIKRKDLQDLSRPNDIVVQRLGVPSRRQRAEQAAARGQTEEPFSFEARLQARRNVWVRSSDLNLELGLSDDFLVQVREATRLSGVVSVIGGGNRGEARKNTVSVIGREFSLRGGSRVTFLGPMSEAAVDVIALHTNEREKVKVTVTVSGTAQAPVLTLTSEPPLSESEIYTLLATGRRELHLGGGATMTKEQALSVIGQMAASQLKTALAKNLPIDVLNFEAVEDTSTGTASLERLKFDVGKYLSDTVYLGVSVQTGANLARGENPYAAHLELQLSRSISLEASAGTAPAASADVMWSRDF